MSRAVMYSLLVLCCIVSAGALASSPAAKPPAASSTTAWLLKNAYPAPKSAALKVARGMRFAETSVELTTATEVGRKRHRRDRHVLKKDKAQSQRAKKSDGGAAKGGSVSMGLSVGMQGGGYGAMGMQRGVVGMQRGGAGMGGPGMGGPVDFPPVGVGIAPPGFGTFVPFGKAIPRQHGVHYYTASGMQECSVCKQIASTAARFGTMYYGLCQLDNEYLDMCHAQQKVLQSCPEFTNNWCYQDMGGSQVLKSPCPVHLLCHYCLGMNPLHCVTKEVEALVL